MLTESILLDLVKLIDPLTGALNHLGGSPAIHCFRGTDPKTAPDAVGHERAGEFSGSCGSKVAGREDGEQPDSGALRLMLASELQVPRHRNGRRHIACT